MLSAALTFGLFIAGRFSADLRNFNQVVDSPAAAALARGAVLGAAEPRAVRRAGRRSSTAQPVSAGYMALTIGYGVLYIAALLVAAAFIFSRRDFK